MTLTLLFSPFVNRISTATTTTTTILRKLTTTTTTTSAIMMQAITIPHTGDADVLNFTRDHPRPACPPTHILVKNSHVGVNFIDTYHRSGLYKVPLPYVPGREASGVVAEVGSAVPAGSFSVGDRVAYMGPNCYADFAIAEPRATVKLEDGVSDEDGAALLLQGATALSLVKVAYEVKKGDYVLVHAAAGGTGRLICQLAKHFGAHVIGTTSTEAKAEVARAAGCADVVLYTQQDLVTEVMRITNGAGVAVVYDGVGKSTFDASLACLRRLGTMASFGNASGKVEDVDIMKLVPKAVRLMRPSLFVLCQTDEDYKNLIGPLVGYLKSGVISLHIHKVYDIKDAAQAHKDLEGRGTQGKLLLKL